MKTGGRIRKHEGGEGCLRTRSKDENSERSRGERVALQSGPAQKKSHNAAPWTRVQA